MQPTRGSSHLHADRVQPLLQAPTFQPTSISTTSLVHVVSVFRSYQTSNLLAVIDEACLHPVPPLSVTSAKLGGTRLSPCHLLRIRRIDAALAHAPIVAPIVAPWHRSSPGWRARARARPSRVRADVPVAGGRARRPSCRTRG